jgi:D-threo-aldose 1-dehydrogenase
VDTPPGIRWEYDYSYDGVMRSYQGSLQRLGVDRLDIVYVHDVDAYCQGGREGSEASIRDLVDNGGWRALDELRSSGDVQAIGAGVNEWQPCARLLELGDPDLFLLAGRYTLLEQEPLQTLFPQCEAQNAGIVIGGPYNSGVLAGTPTYNYAEIPPEIADQVKGIADVCATHNVPMARAALHFVAAHPLVVSVIPGGQNEQETRENAGLLDEKIPPEFWQDLKTRGLIQPDAPTPD